MQANAEQLYLHCPKHSFLYAVDPDTVQRCDESANTWQKKYHGHYADPLLELNHLTFEVMHN